jgi:putative AbiEi antitoxin of type IV toxin-antitoxin system
MRHRHPAQLGDLFSRADALRAGVTRHQVEWALRSGRWVALRRGIYCRSETYDAASKAGRHLLLGRAALLSHDERHVLSHLSAAISYGLPAPLGELGRPTLTIGGAPASTDRQDDLVVQVADLQPHEVRAWNGLRRTSVPRTVADCLRHLPAPTAVPMADTAIRSGVTSLPAIRETLARQSGWPYVMHGIAGAALVDPRRESWLESFSFVALHEEGIALPTPQVDVFDETGAFIGRVDGLWIDRATVAEADGRTKYDAEPDEVVDADAADLAEAKIAAMRRAVIREKVREDRLRAAGLELVRWGTHDIVHARPSVLRAIRAAWRRGHPGRFSGSIAVPTHPGLAVESGL